MDLDVNMKAVLLGAVFLVVSKTAVLDYLAAVKRDFPELCQKLFLTSFSVYQFLDLLSGKSSHQFVVGHIGYPTEK